MRVDEIRRGLVVDAPIERVWEALTSAEELAQWFGDIAEIDLKPGGRGRFGWSEFNSTTDCIIETVDRPSRFSFRWDAVAGSSVEEVLTHVEFTLRSEGGGTHVTMLESGFADLPDDAYQEVIDKNTSGWDAELEELNAYLSGTLRAS